MIYGHVQEKLVACMYVHQQKSIVFTQWLCIYYHTHAWGGLSGDWEVAYIKKYELLKIWWDESDWLVYLNLYLCMHVFVQ